jgi:hypothetical protein
MSPAAERLESLARMPCADCQGIQGEPGTQGHSVLMRGGGGSFPRKLPTTPFTLTPLSLELPGVSRLLEASGVESQAVKRQFCIPAPAQRNSRSARSALEQGDNAFQPRRSEPATHPAREGKNDCLAQG